MLDSVKGNGMKMRELIRRIDRFGPRGLKASGVCAASPKSRLTRQPAFVALIGLIELERNDYLRL